MNLFCGSPWCCTRAVLARLALRPALAIVIFTIIHLNIYVLILTLFQEFIIVESNNLAKSVRKNSDTYSQRENEGKLGSSPSCKRYLYHVLAFLALEQVQQ